MKSERQLLPYYVGKAPLTTSTILTPTNTLASSFKKTNVSAEHKALQHYILTEATAACS